MLWKNGSEERNGGYYSGNSRDCGNSGCHSRIYHCFPEFEKEKEEDPRQYQSDNRLRKERVWERKNPRKR